MSGRSARKRAKRQQREQERKMREASAQTNWNNYSTWVQEAEKTRELDLTNKTARMAAAGIDPNSDHWKRQLQMVNDTYDKTMKEIKGGETYKQLQEFQGGQNVYYDVAAQRGTKEYQQGVHDFARKESDAYSAQRYDHYVREFRRNDDGNGYTPKTLQEYQDSMFQKNYVEDDYRAATSKYEQSLVDAQANRDLGEFYTDRFGEVIVEEKEDVYADKGFQAEQKARADAAKDFVDDESMKTESLGGNWW